MALLLSIKDLCIGIPGKPLLVDNVSIEINRGEIHGLIGESGSGKSLTALSVVQLLPEKVKQISGHITIYGNENEIRIPGVEKAAIQKLRGGEIGYIFQDPMTSLNPSMRCGTQVAEVLKWHGIQVGSDYRSEVISLFKKVRLPDPERAYKAYPHELSGGQRQRVMIAMAVACRPGLLIADEPTTALDVSVQRSIIELINDLRKSDGLGVLFISHDLDVIGGIADRISIMNQGKLVESGIKDEIIHHPKMPYTKGLLACKPPIDKRLKRLPTVSEFLGDEAVARNKLLETEKPKEFSERILAIENLGVRYPLGRNLFGKVNRELHVLKSVSFGVFRGECVGLVGESGSGKSTLGRTIMKLIDAQSGKIFYDGIDISKLTKGEFRQYRKKIQFIFQDPYSSLNSKIRVGQAIAEPLFVHGLCKSRKEAALRVTELLEQVGLKAGDAEKFPHQFSGGQRQRIVIARALSVKPEFIVCDEAVSALDVSVQAQVLNLLKDLKEQLGLTYLFISHDLAVVNFICDRVIELVKGEVLENIKY